MHKVLFAEKPYSDQKNHFEYNFQWEVFPRQNSFKTKNNYFRKLRLIQ